MSGGKSTVNSRSFVRLLAGENLENARKIPAATNPAL